MNDYQLVLNLLMKFFVLYLSAFNLSTGSSDF